VLSGNGLCGANCGSGPCRSASVTCWTSRRDRRFRPGNLGRTGRSRDRIAPQWHHDDGATRTASGPRHPTAHPSRAHASPAYRSGAHRAATSPAHPTGHRTGGHPGHRGTDLQRAAATAHRRPVPTRRHLVPAPAVTLTLGPPAGDPPCYAAFHPFVSFGYSRLLPRMRPSSVAASRTPRPRPTRHVRTASIGTSRSNLGSSERHGCRSPPCPRRQAPPAHGYRCAERASNTSPCLCPPPAAEGTADRALALRSSGRERAERRAPGVRTRRLRQHDRAVAVRPGPAILLPRASQDRSPAPQGSGARAGHRAGGCGAGADGPDADPCADPGGGRCLAERPREPGRSAPAPGT